MPDNYTSFKNTNIILSNSCYCLGLFLKKHGENEPLGVFDGVYDHGFMDPFENRVPGS